MFCCQHPGLVAFAACAVGFAASSAAAQVWGRCLNEITSSDRIVEPNPAPMDYFGNAIDHHDGVMAIGSFHRDSIFFNTGRASLHDAATGARLLELVPNDPERNQLFGYSIALSTDTVAVAAVLDSDVGFNTGAVYLFDRTTGVQRHELHPDSGLIETYFGESIALSDRRVAVGAIREAHEGIRTGVVFVFDTETGALLHRIAPADGAAGDLFGTSVAIEGNTLIVGADQHEGSGAVYIYDLDTAQLRHMLFAPTPAAGDQFGHAIAAEGRLLAVGAVGDDALGNDAGVIELFDTLTGIHLRSLRPLDGGAGQLFGWDVALDQGTLAAGTYRSLYEEQASGSAYLFDAASGDLLAKLLPASPTPHDNFGIVLDLEGKHVTIGAWGDGNDVEFGGAAYRFTLPTPPCIADLNRDGYTDLADIHTFVQTFTDEDLTADVTCDQLLTVSDIAAFVDAFLTGC